MSQIEMHAVYGASIIDALTVARKHGFDFVQLDSKVPTFYVDRLSSGDVRSIGEIAAQPGVSLTFHEPGDNVGIFTDFPAIRVEVAASTANSWSSSEDTPIESGTSIFMTSSPTGSLV